MMAARASTLQNIAQTPELLDQPIDLLVGTACNPLKHSIDPARTDLAVALRGRLTRGFNVPDDTDADLSCKFRGIRQTRLIHGPGSLVALLDFSPALISGVVVACCVRDSPATGEAAFLVALNTFSAAAMTSSAARTVCSTASIAFSVATSSCSIVDPMSNASTSA
jgi:hypothetical protein